MKKRIGIVVLAVVLVCGQLTGAASAASPAKRESGQQAAEILYELDLFRGVGSLPDGSPDFALEQTLTRGQAITMLVRLLGAEEAAMGGGYASPFTDVPKWAAPYVNYGYAIGVTTGVSDTAYGTGRSATLNQFLTFVLRALGYSGVNWRDPQPAADAVGLYYPLDGEFTRADAAAICLDALGCTIRDRGITLFESLRRGGAIQTDRETPEAVFIPGPARPLVWDVTAVSFNDMLDRLEAALQGHAPTITIHVPAGQAENYLRQLGNALYGLSSPLSEANGYSASYFSDTIWLYPSYEDSARVMTYLEGRTDSLPARDGELLRRARAVHDALVTPDMSEYEQVKAFHDWIVDHTEYDPNYLYLAPDDPSYDAAGVLLNGVAVCDGYSKAFDLLCYLSGIDCMRVSGDAGGGSHAWNKVKVDGQWYNVDVTWDDPLGARPMLLYDYFLVSDRTLARDHDWIAYDFWPAAPADYR